MKIYVNIYARLLETMLQYIKFKQATNKHLDNKYLFLVVDTVLISIKTFYLPPVNDLKCHHRNKINKIHRNV